MAGSFFDVKVIRERVTWAARWVCTPNGELRGGPGGSSIRRWVHGTDGR